MNSIIIKNIIKNKKVELNSISKKIKILKKKLKENQRNYSDKIKEITPIEEKLNLALKEFPRYRYGFIDDTREVKCKLNERIINTMNEINKLKNEYRNIHIMLSILRGTSLERIEHNNSYIKARQKEIIKEIKKELQEAYFENMASDIFIKSELSTKV